jgi:hypothetical protein
MIRIAAHQPISTRSAILAATLSVLCAAAAMAQPIELVPGTVNMFRDTRGANDVGIGQGDRFQYGADVVGGAATTAITAIYSASNTVAGPRDCGPFAAAPDFCSSAATFYSPSRLQPWTLRFTRGVDTLDVLGPSLQGTQQAVPFPVSVTLSGTGLTPTIGWQIPGSFAPEGFRVNVFDKNRRTATNVAELMHSVAIDPAATSYTLPSVLTSGLSLANGGRYSINFQLIDTRDDLPFTGNNAQILRRSSSFFSFTPLSGNVPGEVALPTVVNGVYNFNIAQVGPSSITFIDPEVAIGYDYAIGAGDPKFASVLLPNVGDGQFTLEYTDAEGDKSVALAQGAQFFFAAGGVEAFRVRGIETSAMLDPADVTAFITGLTFTGDGSFTGTMKPIVVVVPEPSSYALMLLGLAGLSWVARRKRL